MIFGYWRVLFIFFIFVYLYIYIFVYLYLYLYLLQDLPVTLLFYRFPPLEVARKQLKELKLSVEVI